MSSFAAPNPDTVLYSTGRTERLRVHNPDVLSDLLGDADDEGGRERTPPGGDGARALSRLSSVASRRSMRSARSQTMRSARSFRSHSSWGVGEEPSIDPIQERATAQREARERELAEKEATLAADMKIRLEEKAQRKEAAFQEMYGKVVAGLSYEEGITAEAKDLLDTTAHNKAKKARELCEEWHDSVFNAMQSRLQSSLAGRSQAEISARLRQQMADYVRTCNEKTAVFRDVIIEADYNPLTAHDAAIRIPTHDMADPVKRDTQKLSREAALVGHRDPFAKGAASKSTLDTLLWDKLESTPYGRNMDPEGRYVVKTLDEKDVALKASHIPMDHYNYPRDADAMWKENPPGKRTVQPPEVRRGRKDLFNTLQNVGAARSYAELKAQGLANGDAWLEAKGKKHPPGPEMRRGRKDLYDVVHHTCDRKPKGYTGGDEWLERKGKANPPGPEQRRGRRDLFETFQQASNPYRDRRTLGDAWLEAKGKRRVDSVANTDHDLANLLRNDKFPIAQPPATVKMHMLDQLGHVDGALTVRKEMFKST